MWDFSFRAFHEIQFQGHFTFHETCILSWNTFAFDKLDFLLLQQKEKNSKIQNLSEWNHGGKTQLTKMYKLAYFQNFS